LQEDKDKLGESGNIKHMVEYRKEVSDLAITRLQEVTNPTFYNFQYYTYTLTTIMFGNN